MPEPEPNALTLRLRDKDVWSRVERVKSVEQLAMLADIQEVVAAAIAGYRPEEVVAAIARERGAEGELAERPLRSAEFERMVTAPWEEAGNQPRPGVEFAAYRVPKSRVDLPPGVAGLVVVPELREVRVQVSFSRFDSVSANLQGEFDFDRHGMRPACLTLPSGTQKWLPAAEIRGEGIFVQLDEEAVQAWERRDAVQERAERLRRACAADDREFPGVRFYLLHSLSHLLATAISLECGYSASAIRERIYCGEPDGPLSPLMAGERPMAAVLLSTGTTGSEGTALARPAVCGPSGAAVAEPY